MRVTNKGSNRMSEQANMKEFSTIAGLILDELFQSFPMRVNLSPESAMHLMGVEHPMALLDSGRMYKEVFSSTLSWLVEEGFVNPAGINNTERCRLTAKGLAAMNVVPDLGGNSIAESLSTSKKLAASDEGRSRIASVIGDFIGSAAGSFTKSVSSGG